MSLARGRHLALLLVCASGIAHAQAQASTSRAADTASAAAPGSNLLDKTANVDIDPQDVAAALLSLSRQFGFQSVMGSDALQGQSTQGLHGDMTLKAALAKLLQSTGYGYKVSSDNTITIVSAAAAGAVEPYPTIPVVAVAAQTERTEPVHTEPDGAVRLDDLVVTSTKRPQRLRDIPQSITSLSGDDLERRGAQSLADLIKLVPGVNLSYDVYAPKVTIRGISQSTNTSPTTGAIFGNVSFTDAYLPVATLDANPFDLESVEVLKGPQATLFGASNLNGAIRYVPRAPNAGAWEAKYYGQYTNIEGAWAPSYGGVINAPLFGRDDLALRVTGFVREAPGYVDVTRLNLPDSNKLRQKGARAILAWKPDDWELGFTYAYQSIDVANFAITDNHDGKLTNTQELRLSPSYQIYNLADLSLGYNFGWGKLISESSSLNKTGGFFAEGSATVLTNSPIPLGSLPAHQQTHTYSQELRLSSPDDPAADWHWMVGALAWKQILHLYSAIFIGPAASLPIGLPLNQVPGGLFGGDGVALDQATTDASAREYAVFGEVTRRFWKKLDVTLGGRYYRTLSGGTNVVTGIAALDQAPSNPTSPTELRLQGTIPEHGFNPKVAVSLHATRNIMTYVSVTRGYRVGGVQYGVALLPQPQNPVPTVFKSDTIWNYEAGIRTEWLGRALRFDVTGFLERWNNPQYYTPDATSRAKYITNVGGVRSTGAEAALQLITPWGIALSTTGAYAKTVTTAVFKAPDGADDPPGTPWPYSPRWQTASTLAYIANFSSWNLNTGVTYTYLGQAIANLSSKQPIFGYRQLDFQVTVSNPSIRWLPEFNVSLGNALNERGVGSQSESSKTSTSQSPQVTYIQPRTINLRIAGHF